MFIWQPEFKVRNSVEILFFINRWVNLFLIVKWNIKNSDSLWDGLIKIYDVHAHNNSI